MGLCLALLGSASAAEAPAMDLLEPQLRLPPARKAPVVDGEIGDAEWAGAWVCEGSTGSADQALEERRAWAYLTYDKENVYFAVKSETRPDGRLWMWPHDPDEAIMQMDGIEIWAAALYDPGKPPIDNYQLWYGPYGTQWGLVFRYGAGFAVQEQLKRGTKIFDGHWHFELAFPWRLLGLKPGDVKDGQHILVRPTRNWRYGFIYASWGGEGAFYKTDNMMRVVLDSQAPVVRVLDLGKPFDGKAAVEVEIANPTGKPAEIGAKLRIGSYGKGASWGRKGPGEELVTADKTVTVPAGKTVRVTLPANYKPVPLLPAKQMNSQRRTCHYSMQLNVSRKSDGATLYSRFLKIPGRRDARWRDLPSRKIKLRGGYYPYYGKIKATLDLGDDPRSKGVTRAVVTVHRGDEAKAMAQGTIDVFRYNKGEAIIDVGDLKTGEYQMRLALYAGDKAVALDPPVTRTIEREKQPWEHTTVGKTDKVYPPFTPIVVEGNTISCVLRDHTLNGLGLWDQVVSKGKPILAAPMRLECRSGGNLLEWETGLPLDFKRKRDHEVVHDGIGDCAVLTWTANVLWEYDGMMKVELELDPRGTGQVDELELVIPIRDDVVSLLHSTTQTRSNPSFALPEKEGILWDSRSMVQTVGKGSFTPYVWIGGVERGVCWFADNAQGWITDDEEPAIEIERAGDAVNMRVRFINRPGVVKDQRRIVFGLMATPAKPLAAESRAWWSHYSSGKKAARRVSTSLSSWRFVGFSNTETLTPLGADFSIFDYFAKHQGTGNIKKEERDFLRSWVVKHIGEKKARDIPSQLAKTFNNTKTSDEAVYYTNPALESGSTPQGKQFRNEWKGGIGGLGCNFVDSYNDYAAWCYDQILATGLKCHLYQDNTFPVASTDVIAGGAYVREDGRVQCGWNVFGHREFYKRLFVVGWERMGRLPLTYPHTTNGMVVPQFSFAGMHLALEWQQKTMRTFQEKFPFALLRTEVMGKQAGVAPRILCQMGDTPPSGLSKEKGNAHALEVGYLFRTREGTLLLHDSYPRDLAPYIGIIVGELMPLGFHQESCRFVGYWEKPKLVKASDGCEVSLFHMDKGILAVVVDTSGKKVVRKITVDEKVLGRKVKAIRDFEREVFEKKKVEGGRLFEVGNFSYGTAWRYFNLDNGFTKVGSNAVSVNLRKHDYVLLLIE